MKSSVFEDKKKCAHCLATLHLEDSAISTIFQRAYGNTSGFCDDVLKQPFFPVLSDVFYDLVFRVLY